MGKNEMGEQVGGMNSRMRKKFYPMLVARDGEYCNICGRVGSTKSLIIDHIDNDKRNNKLENLQLLCRRCNYMKNPRGKSKPLNAHSDIQAPLPSVEIALSKKYKATFYPWLYRLISECGRVARRDILDAGAEVTGAGQQAIDRYLRACSSFEGMYEEIEIDGVIYIQFRKGHNPK